MVELTVKVENAAGEVLKERTNFDYADLTYGGEYQEGDKVVIECSETNIPLKIQVDDALGMAMVLIAKNRIEYPVPFGSRMRAHSPKVFSGRAHYIFARTVPQKEWDGYRNLALNVMDLHGEAQCYPHVSANCETRDESVFAARNTVDNVTANYSHGRWPFHSWGINKQDDACLTMEFGRDVKVDTIVLHTRADFPHDNWWNRVTFTFSDGTTKVVELEKSTRPHIIPMDGKVMSSFTFDQLIKGDQGEEASEFPALTQIEVFGENA